MNNSTTITQADGSIVHITRVKTTFGFSPRDFLNDTAGLVVIVLIAFFVFRLVRRARRKKPN